MVLTETTARKDTRAPARPVLLRRLALATLIGNALIVVTGAAVRLTSSGLGCPTWPKCTQASYTNTPALGIHGYIEFGNRVLSVLLAVAVGLTIIAAVRLRPRRRSLVLLASAQFGGFVAQGAIGGITVLTGLNPWTVAAHFLVSMALIFGAYALWHRAGEGDGPRRFTVGGPLVGLARAITLAAAAVLAVGTVVTGSGPHSGDQAAARTGFDPATVSQFHADLVFLLVGLTISAALAFPASSPLRTAALALLAAELVQGAIGFVQYFLHLPVLAVALHVAGAAVLWIAVCRLLFLTRTRSYPG